METNIEEIWKDVVGYEGLYQVSSLGRVRSLSKVQLLKNGIKRPVKERLLCSGYNGNYYQIILTNNKKTKTFLLHRLIAEAFITNPDPKNKTYVNHIDGNKRNNSLENLQWVTASENVILAHFKGLTNPQKGMDRQNSKLKDNDIPEIRRQSLIGIPIGVIARNFMVNRAVIKGIIKGTRWKHILMIAIFIITQSCSSSWHLKRAKKHELIAISKGATIYPDTVWKEVPIYIQAVKKDTLFISKPGDTVLISKDRLQIKYVRLPGDTVWIDGECEADTIIKTVPVAINNEIKAEKSHVKWWTWLLIGFFAGAVIVWFRR